MVTGAVVATALPAQAAFPGANGKIAFVRDQAGQNIYVMNPDGSAQTQLTTTGRDTHPAWSADGLKIAFASDRDFNGGEIYVMNADGSTQTRLTTTSDVDYDPTWSPDGQRIAFTSFRNGDSDIYVMNAIPGSAQTPLTTSPGADIDPAWSPDGQKIAFTSTRDGTHEIYVMDANGSNQTRLTNDPHFSLLPAWSPDGERIAFWRQGSFGPGEIWVMDANGSNQTRLTVSTATGPTDETLAWSPDGEKIAFERIDNGSPGSRDIWTMNADGSAQTQLPSPGTESFPDWQPLPSPIVFVHGFLGSRIVCGSDELWPNIPGSIPHLGPRLLDMRLDANGVSNLPGTCGAQVGGILDEITLGPFQVSDVYKSTIDFLNRIAPGHNYIFTWDWRTSPAESLAELDQFVDNVRAQNANAKVVLMAHSMGGLLTRWYVDDQTRADKVARALTIGTPYWGSPKSLFPLAAGIEVPGGGDLDPVLDDPELREFARNLLGLYFLWPSESYGPWLNVLPGPHTLDRAGLLDYVGNQLGGNRTLLEQALDAHASILDGFETNGVDYRVVVGTGLSTVSRITIFEDEVVITYATGDGTVPAKSGVQGTPGTIDPLGEDVPISYACGVGHVPLPGHPDVDNAIQGFLLSGADMQGPGLSSIPCSSSGFQVQVFPVVIGPVADSSTGAVQQTSDAPGNAVSLEDAEFEGRVQVLAFPSQTIVVTDAARPVELALPPGPFILEVTPLYDEEEGPTLVYGPLDGQVTLAASETLTVFEDGQEVEPVGTDTTPPTVAGVPDRAPNAAGWYNVPVAIDWQATDDSGFATDPPDTIASTEGAGVAYTSEPSCDPSGNCATGSLILSIDRAAPVVTVPADGSVDATSPAGAVVTYSAAASDLLDPAPSLSCLPASGSVFPIGTTVVTCTATDAAGNAASAVFNLEVRGAPAQIARLSDKTLAFVDLPWLRAVLRALLEAAAHALAANNAPAACWRLNLYIAVVKFAPPGALSAAEKAELIGDATRIRAVIACGG